MSNFKSFFDKIKKEHRDNEGRGRRFELFCKWFLKNDPTYTDKFKNIWLWYEWPDREKNRFGQDIGIDLVAETHEGNLWAIQAKCYSDPVPTNEIDKFLSVSGRKEFNYRLLISTSDVSKNGRTKIKEQSKPVDTILRENLDNSNLNLDKFFDLPGEDSELPELREYIDSQNITIENLKNKIETYEAQTKYQELIEKPQSLNKVRRNYKIMGYAIATLSILALGLIGILMNKNQDIATLQQNIATLQQDNDTKSSQINSIVWEMSKSEQRILESLHLPAPIKTEEIKQGTFKPLEDLVLRFDVKAQQKVVFTIYCQVYCEAYIRDPDGNMIRDFRSDRSDNRIKQGTTSIENATVGGEYSVFLKHPFSQGAEEKWNYEVTVTTETIYQ